MMYDIRHRTTFTYEDVVSVSHHVLHLSPRRHPRQRALRVADRAGDVGAQGVGHAYCCRSSANLTFE